jgi:ElaB/YqjD/DUF883 family membrane-anchored ribosome-binding protein
MKSYQSGKKRKAEMRLTNKIKEAGATGTRNTQRSLHSRTQRPLVRDDALHRIRSFQDDGKQYVRENPIKAVFTALAVGFVLGLMFRR